MTPRELLDSASITEVWAALGGPRLRRGRGQAWWRSGDGYNIALDESKGAWFDHARGKGGGILALIETTLACDRRCALSWLADHLGALLDDNPLSETERRAYAERRRKAKARARELTEWREGSLFDLRAERNQLWRSEREASRLALQLLRDGKNEDPRWDAIWKHALDDQRGDDVDRAVFRVEALSPAELIATRRRLETEAA